MAHREFKYVAIVPLDCGLPDGSIHHYNQGDYIPSEVLGRAIGPLVLADKVARIILSVDDEDGPAEPIQAAPPEPSTGSYAENWAGGTVAEHAAREQLIAEHELAAQEQDEAADEDTADYPQHLGGG